MSDRHELYDEVFAFLHGEHLRERGIHFAHLYIAADPQSSRGFGSTLITITLAQSARAFAMAPDGGLAQCTADLDRKFPGFEAACGLDLAQISPTVYAVLEDNSVALVDYFYAVIGAENAREWFQLISPELVESMQ